MTEYIKTDSEYAESKLRPQGFAEQRNKYTKEEREQESDPKVLQKANKLVTRPITRISYGGRPIKYSPRKFRNKMNDYLTHCEKRDKIPSIKGLMLYMKLNASSAYVYSNRPEYKDLFDQFRMAISEWLETDVFATKGQATGKIAYMQNNWNWSNKTEVETSQREMTVEEAKAKIEAIAPAILELLKSSPELVRQLLPAPETKQEVIEVECE